MSTELKLVVFDLDGTLVDSGAIILDLLNELRQELRRPLISYQEVIPLLSLGGEKLIEKGLNVAGADVARYLKIFRENYKNRPTPADSIFDGVRDLLCDLSSREYFLAICTNKPRFLAQKVLKELAIDDFFSVMCADGDLSTKKPNPENLLFCLNAFGVSPSQSLLVGDSKVDQDLALACKVPFAWFTAGNDDGVNPSEVAFQFDSYVDFKSWLFPGNN